MCHRCVISVLYVVTSGYKCVIICAMSGYNFTHKAIRGGLCVVLVVLCVVYVWSKCGLYKCARSGYKCVISVL